MSLLQQTLVDTALLDRLAGISGLGWIVAGLVYVATRFGIGNGVVPPSRTLVLIGGLSLVAMICCNQLELALTNGEGHF